MAQPSLGVDRVERGRADQQVDRSCMLAAATGTAKQGVAATVIPIFIYVLISKNGELAGSQGLEGEISVVSSSYAIAKIGTEKHG